MVRAFRVPPVRFAPPGGKACASARGCVVGAACSVASTIWLARLRRRRG
jgi:hypothetical protein